MEFLKKFFNADDKKIIGLCGLKKNASPQIDIAVFRKRPRTIYDIRENLLLL